MSMSHPSIAERSVVWLGWIMDGAIFFALSAVPLVWIPWITNSLELPKQTIVIAAALFGLLAWFAASFLTNRFAIPRAWMLAAAAAFAIVMAGLATFSPSRYLAFIGDAGQLPWSVASIAAFVILAFLMAQRAHSIRTIHSFYQTVLLVGSLLAVFGIVQAMRGESFTPVGSIYGLSIYLTAPLLLAATLLSQRHRLHGFSSAFKSQTLAVVEAPLPWLAAILSLWLLLLTNMRGAWIAVGAGSAVLLLASLVHFLRDKNWRRMIVPAMLVLAAILFSVWRTPLAIKMSPEVSPSASASWELARQILTTQPLQGTGQGTWAFDYAQYRPAAINQTPFWNVRFERSFSTLLTLLPTIGLLGVGCWLLLLALTFWHVGRSWVVETKEETRAMLLSGGVAFAALSAAAFVYNFSMAQQTLWWLLFGILISITIKQVVVWKMERQNASAIAIAMIGGALAVGSVGAWWLLGQRFVADAYAWKSARAYEMNQPLDEVIRLSERSRFFNQHSDAFARAAADAHLSKALLLMKQKPSAEQFGPVYQEVADATDRALAAVKMEPHQAQNYLALGFLYERIMTFTKGADEHAITNFERAAALEPSSPIAHTEIGNVWFARAETAKALLDAKDATVAARARADFNQALQKAEEHLKMAVLLKPDFLPAHYRLAAIAERRGRLPEAIGELEGVLRANNKDAGIAFELAILYYRNREGERARVLLEQVVRAQSDNDNARWYLASLYEEEGRLDDALMMLRPLSAKMPANSAVQERVRRLEEGTRTLTAPQAETLPEPLAP